MGCAVIVIVSKRCLFRGETRAVEKITQVLCGLGEKQCLAWFAEENMRVTLSRLLFRDFLSHLEPLFELA